ncbi:M48 family metallopeptidase [Phaeobacter inhibens]|uniref:M48 family metallopeptidase n=1 Tax=Phaeobacter inhibens TaxID=221822 RepID=UPI000C9AE248|nr:SprT family zinc-dependent metalloprotease [Phaeobacter inhibens]AUQ59818.1 putative metal-dependent hydrolase [Phaeobacter inhibens]AUQ63879.1 putative metal-dependent hydrolase [Phaeobacter inhibens]AUQ83784.1 putative metal-dependent hydrolase [Phaeobacter inhibens]AUQ91591.1 putative metal-dependent hydrolase [Phaeobacter inhibens]AUR09085.1 putative metal-dependent hydrolase [Phaeobacter inhibens]
MADHHLPGEPPVPLTLRRSARARRISLRISGLDGRVTLTLPSRVPDREALDFAREKEGWIRDHLAQHPECIDVDYGCVLPIDGQPRHVVAGRGRRVLLDLDQLTVPGAASGAKPGRRIQRYLQELARDRLAAASDHYAAALGRPYSRISLRDTRSRWGSCSSDGALMYSWRLILAPSEVLRYVAAHEVAHLAEMNHSPAFWATVRQLYGNYDGAREWLRREGNQLHRYRF